MSLITWSALHGGGHFPIARLFNLDGVIDRARVAALPTRLPVEQTEFRVKEQRIPFPNTLAGQAVLEFLKAFNADDHRGLRRFFATRMDGSNVAAESHAQVWFDWRGRFGQLTPHTLERSTEYEIVLLATAGDRSEWRLELSLHPQAPHHLKKFTPDLLRSNFR